MADLGHLGSLEMISRVTSRTVLLFALLAFGFSTSLRSASYFLPTRRVPTVRRKPAPAPRESSGRATIRHGVTAAAARATTVAANAINGDAVSKAVTVKYSASIPGGRPAPASPG